MLAEPPTNVDFTSMWCFTTGGTLLKRKEKSLCVLFGHERADVLFSIAFIGCFCRLLLPDQLLLYTLYFSGLFLLLPRKAFLWIQSRSFSVVSDEPMGRLTLTFTVVCEWVFLASAGEANANSQPCRSKGPGLWELNSFCGKTDGQTRIGVQEGRDSVVGGTET